jgi:hypothetical protein
LPPNESRDVATRARKAGDESAANRIGYDKKHDRDRLGLALKRGDRLSRVRNEQIGRQANELFRKSLHALDVPSSPANVDPDVLAVRPAKLPERGCQRRQSCLALRIAFSSPHQDADPPHGTGLLRSRNHRPRRSRASEHSEKLPPPHVSPSLSKQDHAPQTGALIGPETSFAPAA